MCESISGPSFGFFESISGPRAASVSGPRFSVYLLQFYSGFGMLRITGSEYGVPK